MKQEGLTYEEFAEQWASFDLDKEFAKIMDKARERRTIYAPIGYEFQDENGNVIEAKKIVLEKKKKEYPKTYEECCEVLGVEGTWHVYSTEWEEYDKLTPYEKKLDYITSRLKQILICRDAYWKITGEEMGLGKPWEPDWDTREPKYVIACTSNGIKKQWETTYCKGFAFPTEEMRDAFYKNFKGLIEVCKELL